MIRINYTYFWVESIEPSVKNYDRYVNIVDDTTGEFNEKT